MDDQTLRARLVYALSLALGAAGATGCCEVKETSYTQSERNSFPSGGWGTRTCTEVCTTNRECSSGSPLVRCSFAGDVGDRTATCVFETSDCPVPAGYPRAVCGRRHEGAREYTATAGEDPLGGCFASMATLEAGAVPAFERLVLELEAHGAPEGLVEDARRAVVDERHHAAAMTRLALEHGGRVPPCEVTVGPRRAIEAIALENAAEGCVRETWGALVALWQSQRARDPRVREALARIAEDEVRHAALAWRVDAWACERLGPDLAERTEEARREALAELRAERGEPHPDVWTTVGVPTSREASLLLDACERALWARGGSA